MLIRFGVVVISWLAIISGVTGALIGGFAVLAGTLLDVQAPVGRFSAEGASGLALVFIGLAFAIAGVAQIIFGVGLWRLRGWAWTLGVLLQSLTLLGALGGLFTGAFTVQSIISIAVSGTILFYLLSPRVRKLFGRRTTQLA
ncbi:MAG TPA: hypothetical protein VF812_04995 [Ktedonobacterales bacterium]